MKKFRNLWVALSMCALLLVSFIAVPETTEATSAPDTIFVKNVLLPCKSVSYCAVEPQYYERPMNGYLYRGYLAVQEVIYGNSALYYGKLYRAPLPYPTPF